MKQKPAIHGRDHRAGGEDPIGLDPVDAGYAYLWLQWGSTSVPGTGWQDFISDTGTQVEIYDPDHTATPPDTPLGDYADDIFPTFGFDPDTWHVTLKKTGLYLMRLSFNWISFDATDVLGCRFHTITGGPTFVGQGDGDRSSYKPDDEASPEIFDNFATQDDGFVWCETSGASGSWKPQLYYSGSASPIVSGTMLFIHQHPNYGGYADFLS